MYGFPSPSVKKYYPGHVPVSDEKRNIFDASSIMRVILQIKVLLSDKLYTDLVYV